MSYKQVKYFQDLEDYAAAYKMARADWEADPLLKWPKNSIAWLLIKMMKANARALSKDVFIRQLEEFCQLGIPKDDSKLWGAVAWPIRDIVQDSWKMQWFTPQFGDELFAAIKDMPFDKPSESYSAMGKSFIRLSGLWPRLAGFIEWWGFDNFTDFDYRRYPEDGVLESLAEKVYSAYLVALHREDEHREPSKAFFEGLDNLAFRCKEQADKVYKILSFDKKMTTQQ